MDVMEAIDSGQPPEASLGTFIAYDFAEHCSSTSEFKELPGPPFDYLCVLDFPDRWAPIHRKS